MTDFIEGECLNRLFQEWLSSIGNTEKAIIGLTSNCQRFSSFRKLLTRLKLFRYIPLYIPGYETNTCKLLTVSDEFPVVLLCVVLYVPSDGTGESFFGSARY